MEYKKLDVGKIIRLLNKSGIDLMRPKYIKKAPKPFKDHVRPEVRAAWNEERPHIETRQQRRAEQRKFMKEMYTASKKAQADAKGGMAAYG